MPFILKSQYKLCNICSFSSRLSYYAVFDGHGGVRASRFASTQLHENLAQKFPKGIHSVPV